ncbi:Regulatory protein SdiA [Jannaschia aquimarina]|uniref:SdiA protein n=2 Tax=Jannaschia aquimarina TaxID=935700 RepID=A0A0D1EI54_9RHOB|nr:LuxR C-terminal-related transcriptional regulator [Jannaschia aquimarina]KIT16581.1 Regulatory protein SdiA [Jannaschia aquimarina]SNT41552.1 LuxR family transcriptional regulator [Jannaschia aquimarina]
MLETLIPNLDDELARLRRTAPSGFVLAFNWSVMGPEHMISEFPAEWRTEYEEKNYMVADPILIWAFSLSGVRRWSEVRLPDIRKVLERGRAHGLAYGAVFSQKRGLKRSVLSIAHDSREFTDEEIDAVDARFSLWCDLATNQAALTAKEIAVLQLLRDGEGQKEIAQILQIAETTVKQRAVSATKKLGAKNRTQAVAIALKRGFLDHVA